MCERPGRRVLVRGEREQVEQLVGTRARRARARPDAER
jgi:hypothetical protein